MNSTTLRGVFPEPKPIQRRNFIKENVKQIRQMQGLLQQAGVIQSKKPTEDRFRTAPPAPHRMSRSRDVTPERRHHKSNSLQKVKSNPTTKSLKPKHPSRKLEPMINSSDCKITHRSMQTERTDDLHKLYETGVIKYPSAHLPLPNKGQGDDNKGHGGDILEEDCLANLELDDSKDFIRENMRVCKAKNAKKEIGCKVPAQAPEGYQRGVVPKYLRDRKEEEVDTRGENDIECPMGHVLLPEEERKETLRVLRQSYADRIQELNSMPVRNDTLRMRRRKNDIEEELKKIDGGIKVFQRPKVFVKINA